MGLVGSEDSPALSVTWAHRAEQSASAWARAHARGEVPSVWPYGLDALRDHAVVEVDELPDPGRIARLRARAGVGPRPRAGFAIAWDENTAYRLQILRPRTRYAAGVIWLTDMAAAGAAPGRLVAMLRAATALWVLSEAQVVPLQRLLGADAPRIFVVPFGIDHEFFGAQPPAARPRIVSAGNDRDRDPATLYAALALVLAARPGVDVVVQSPSALPPPEGVRLVRRLPHTELRDLYATASVVVTATRPNLHASGMTVALEALATARPWWSRTPLACAITSAPAPVSSSRRRSRRCWRKRCSECWTIPTAPPSWVGRAGSRSSAASRPRRWSTPSSAVSERTADVDAQTEGGTSLMMYFVLPPV